MVTGDNCRNSYSYLNHAMIVVGYGVDSETSKEYGIVKNSWGSAWGDAGYVKVELLDDASGACGMYHENTYTLV